MSRKSTGSKFSSASNICRNETEFVTWAAEVSAQAGPRKEVPGGRVAEMVERSKRLPEWLLDINSIEFKLFESFNPQQVQSVQDWLRHRVANDDPSDEVLAKDVLHALPHIIYLNERHISLVSDGDQSYNESDLRQPLDRLASHVWCTEVGTKEGFRFRSECTVKLPDTQLVPIVDATVDSIAFSFDLKPGYLQLAETTKLGLTCTTTRAKSLELVHWVTEYKKSNTKEVQRQVYFGLVSGLWQRRALGRMNDFVFGTAHSYTTVWVYAARWEKGPPRHPGEAVQLPPDLLKDPPDSAQSASEPGPLRTGSSRSTEIVVYEIAQYETTAPLHMIEFYLLMRASRKLVTEYLQDISYADIFATGENAKVSSRFEWAAPPRHEAKNQSPSILEEPGPSGGHQVAYVADPEEEAVWKVQWERERQNAVRKHGGASLQDFEITESKTEIDFHDYMLHGDPSTLAELQLSEVDREEPADALLYERMRLPVLPNASISSTKRCLLVLDLNGTLLHRRRTKSNANAHIYARPYLGSFLRYISHPATGLDVAVWSSARRENVQNMIERAWGGAEASRLEELGSYGRARFPKLVFAREDMVLTDRQFKRAFRHGTFNPDHNVRTTKDLRQLWLHLSQMRDEQLRTQAQDLQPAVTQTNTAPLSLELTTLPGPGLTRVLDLHGPHDTILLDDSAHKARLQPSNFLACPTYGAAELRMDANALTTTVDNVDEALLAAVGILSEMQSGQTQVDEWTRTGRVWSGPGARLNPNEMWAQRRKGSAPAPLGSTLSTSTSVPGPSLSCRLGASPTLPKSTLEPDPPFTPNTRPMAIGTDTPAWFTSPPLVRAWVNHGRRVLAGLGIAAEHECVKVWPGWRDGRLEIMGKAKDDVLVVRQGEKPKRKEERGTKWQKPKGQERAEWDTDWRKRP